MFKIFQHTELIFQIFVKPFVRKVIAVQKLSERSSMSDLSGENQGSVERFRKSAYNSTAAGAVLRLIIFY